MRKGTFFFPCCNEEPFSLSSVTNPTSLPSDVVNACLNGRHVPVVPHRQRLLVASIKEARLAKDAPKPKAAPNEKSKENEPGGEETGLKDTKDAVVPKKKAYAPTPYGIAKIEFFAKFLGFCSHIGSPNTCETFQIHLLCLLCSLSLALCWEAG